MTFKEYLSEAYSTSYKVLGKTIELFKNPTKSEIDSLHAKEIRGIMDKSDNILVWDSEKGVHDNIVYFNPNLKGTTFIPFYIFGNHVETSTYSMDSSKYYNAKDPDKTAKEMKKRLETNKYLRNILGSYNVTVNLEDMEY